MDVAPVSPAGGGGVYREDQHFSNIVTTLLVGSLREEGGDALVASVLHLAGETRGPDVLAGQLAWSSHAQVRRLFEATASLCGGPERLFGVGARAHRDWTGAAYHEIFRTIGSPSGLLARIAEMSTMMSSIVTAESSELGPSEWVVVQRMRPGFEPFRECCWFYAGLTSNFPRIYGLGPAEVVEEACQAEGAAACRYRVTWHESPTAEDRDDQFELLSDLLAARLGELQRTVGDLVGGDDIEVILAEIVASARRAVSVPCYVLALEALPAATRRVYAEGAGAADAQRVAERLLGADRDDAGEGMLVVEVRSARRGYGRLAAIDPTLTRRFMPEERKVLETYASVAAAALDAASALDDARRQATMAEAMSELLAEERSLLSKIVEGLPHGVGWTGSGGAIEGCNQALVELLGRSQVKEVAGHLWSEVCPDLDTAGQVEAWSAEVGAEGRPVINAELALGGGEARRVVLVSLVPLSSGGDDGRVLSLWADVTSQRVLEQRLAEASRLEAIGQLAAGIAHEINTPMQYIGDNGAFLDKAFGLVDELVDELVDLAAGHGVDRARIEALTSKAKLDLLKARIPQATGQVTEGVAAVAQIVRSLKTFAHPGSDEYVAVDLRQALESTTTVSRSEWRYVADLDLDLPDDLPPVRAVPGLINQVLLNLIVNAAHAIDERRQAEHDDNPGRITISGRSAGGLVEILVADDGCGIPEPIRAKVYDQFVTTKPVGKGTGQGLAISRNIVTGHDGSIDFTTSPAGTTFTVRLPVWVADHDAVDRSGTSR